MEATSRRRSAGVCGTDGSYEYSNAVIMGKLLEGFAYDDLKCPPGAPSGTLSPLIGTQGADLT